VVRANDQLAIHKLLITDSLFRSQDVQERRRLVHNQFATLHLPMVLKYTSNRYIDLVESVREHGGEVHIFSTMHVSGNQLKMVRLRLDCACNLSLSTC
jgi:protein pelota